MANFFAGPIESIIEPFAEMFGMKPEPVKVDVKLKDGDIINSKFWSKNQDNSDSTNGQD